MEIDSDRIDEAVLALLYLGLHDRSRAWKGFDWDALDRLHQKGFISDPVSKAKSVTFTEDGLREAERLFRELFAARGKLRPQAAGRIGPITSIAPLAIRRRLVRRTLTALRKVPFAIFRDMGKRRPPGDDLPEKMAAEKILAHLELTASALLSAEVGGGPSCRKVS